MIKILLIDDEEMLLENVSYVLKNSGYDVVTANNGKEGIINFDNGSFDLVITDLYMPIYTGDEVAKHVYNSERKVPVIGITGSSLKFDLSCFDMVIKKPFRIAQFLQSVKDVLDIK